MLFTRCPDCDTTFRVTDEVLKKANGQVRCGRCASVFNALSELRQVPDRAPLTTAPGESEPPAAESAAVMAAEPSSQSPPPPPSPSQSPPPPLPESAAREPTTEIPEPAAGTVAEATAAVDSSRTSAERALAVATTLPTQRARTEARSSAPPPPENGEETITLSGGLPADEQLGALVADVVAQVERGGAALDGADASELDDADTRGLLVDGATPRDRTAISAAEVDAVLNSDATIDTASNEALAASILAWPSTEASARRTRAWSVAAACAVIVLGLQVVHHFRGDLVKNSIIGPIIRNAYGLFGATITPHWDVHQYAVLDWVATAEPNASGRGTLEITARIQNRGPLAQPYPLVQLRLKDRWEAAVGSRIFKPSEYLDRAIAPNVLMSPGATTRARLEVVDPGPDAYGFDLDVCIEVETDVLSCGSDKVFL